MEFQESDIRSTKDWRFIEEHLPRYYSRDDVLMCDILLRYIEQEDMAWEDIQMIEENFHANRQEVFTILTELENKLMVEALENFQVKEIKL